MLESYDGWADNVRKLLDDLRPALESMDYEMAGLAFDGIARGATAIGTRVHQEAQRRKDAGW